MLSRSIEIIRQFNVQTIFRMHKQVTLFFYRCKLDEDPVEESTNGGGVGTVSDQRDIVQQCTNLFDAPVLEYEL